MTKRKTLVRFITHIIDKDVTALFPQLKYNKRLYGNTLITSYAHIGQHSAAAYDLHLQTGEWDSTYRLATKEEYLPLLLELQSIGYENLKVIDPIPDTSTFTINKIIRKRHIRAIMRNFHLSCKQAIAFLRSCNVNMPQSDNLFMSKSECDNYDYETQFL